MDRIVVGLGNPGPKYADTRHNVGFRVVQVLAARWRAAPWELAAQSLVTEAEAGSFRVLLALPQTYMNRSGTAVLALLERTGLEPAQLLVVHDDLDLPPERLRIRTGGGHGGHNGLRSLLSELPNGDFLRLKVGVGRPPPGEEVVDYVLSPFPEDERERLTATLDRAALAAETAVLEGAVAAMNRFNG